jgi:transposase
MVCSIYRVLCVTDGLGPVDRSFACFSCSGDMKKTTNGMVVGIDVGLRNCITLSNGEVIDKPRFLDGSIDRIKRL